MSTIAGLLGLLITHAQAPSRAADSESIQSIEKPAGEKQQGEQQALVPKYNSSTGAHPNIYGATPGKGTWSDLPQPDASWASLPDDRKRPMVWDLSTDEQNKILRSRFTTGSLFGPFYEFNNLMYASQEPYLMTTSPDASKTILQTVHFTEYKPTRAELFETMARQTKTSVKYDPTFMSKWIATPPAMPLPYSIKLAENWESEDRGMYVAHHPKVQPIGMDIYMLGRYSGLTPDMALKVRGDNAMHFARNFDPTITASAMKEVKIDGSDALFYETKPPKRLNSSWRQWSLIKNGQAFLIVSAIADENASLLIPQVDSMVASFHVLEQAAPSPGL